jgi:hypothetical protein
VLVRDRQWKTGENIQACVHILKDWRRVDAQIRGIIATNCYWTSIDGFSL